MANEVKKYSEFDREKLPDGIVPRKRELVEETSYPIFNGMIKTCISEIGKHAGINPMYTPFNMPDNMFYGMSIDAVEIPVKGKLYIDFINESIMKSAIYNCIMATSYAMPALFISIPNEVLENYDYEWKLDLKYDDLYKFLRDLGGIRGYLGDNSYPHHIEEGANELLLYLENIYKNLIRYGFEVVVNIKKKLNEGDNGYMPEQMMITRNPNMQQNGQFVVPTAPIFQPMGPEDIAANPDDRFKDQVMQPFATPVGSVPPVQEEIPGQMTMQPQQQGDPIRVHGNPINSASEYLENVKKQYYKDIGDITTNANNMTDEEVVQKMTEIRQYYYQTYGLTPEFLDGNVVIKPEDGRDQNSDQEDKKEG